MPKTISNIGHSGVLQKLLCKKRERGGEFVDKICTKLFPNKWVTFVGNLLGINDPKSFRPDLRVFHKWYSNFNLGAIQKGCSRFGGCEYKENNVKTHQFSQWCHSGTSGRGWNWYAWIDKCNGIHMSSSVGFHQRDMTCVRKLKIFSFIGTTPLPW